MIRHISSKKKHVFDVEEEVFVKMLKQREHSLVEQLQKAATQISILSLLRIYEAHRDSLLKYLNESHIPSSINPHGLEHFVEEVLAIHIINFIEDELIEDG